MNSCEGGHPERRAQTRHPCGMLRSVSVRVRPGHAMAPIDVSPAGMLVEGEQPLRPGAAIEVQMRAGDRRIATRGRVVRCVVSKLRTGRVWYRAAISFDVPHPWFAADVDRGYSLPIAEIEPLSADRGESAR